MEIDGDGSPAGRALSQDRYCVAPTASEKWGAVG